MAMWQLWSVIGVLFLILEMFTPAMFFLNFALAAFVVAVISLFFTSQYVLIPLFVVFSGVLLLGLRPLLRRKATKAQETGMESKYIGKIAKVITPVNEVSGTVGLYDERWDARSIDKTEIPIGAEVKIVKNESLVLFVEKLNRQ